MNSSRVSIVIVSYNTKHYLRLCFDALRQTTTFAQQEVIVVDNSSEDDSIAMIQDEYPEVILICNNHNVGFSEANNQGMAKATGDFVFLLNPDTEVKCNTIAQLIHTLETEPQAVLAVPKLLNSDGSLQKSAWKSSGIGLLIAELFFLHHKMFSPAYSDEQYAQSFQPEIASGAALLFKKSLLQHLHGLDAQFFWSEDADFCIRAAKQGRIMYVPDAEVVHHGGKSSVNKAHIVIPNQLLSKLKLIRKHDGRWKYFIACFVGLLFITSRISLFGVLFICRRKYRLKFSAYIIALRKWWNLICKGDYPLT